MSPSPAPNASPSSFTPRGCSTPTAPASSPWRSSTASAASSSSPSRPAWPAELHAAARRARRRRRSRPGTPRALRRVGGLLRDCRQWHDPATAGRARPHRPLIALGCRLWRRAHAACASWATTSAGFRIGSPRTPSASASVTSRSSTRSKDRPPAACSISWRWIAKARTYYSVEVQLGEIDASHGFRVFDYWARNRARLLGKTHVAVLMAENAAGRYRPALEALAETVP